MTDIFEFTDELGPEKVLGVYDPKTSLRGLLVIDNVACGPAIGGCRMAPDVTLAECTRLARTMTLKNAAAGLPHGGGKSAILGDPKMPPAEKERLVRAFARAIEQISDYVIAPDMGTDEQAIAWAHDEIGRAVGLPKEIGGIPLDEIGITGFGLAIAAEVAQEFCDVRLEGARFAVQGFGAVGRNVSRFLCERGAILVATADRGGTIVQQDGLDVGALIALTAEGHSVSEYPGGESKDRDAIVGVDCDIWIPAARPDVLHAGNAGEVKAKLVLEGANIPATLEAEEMLRSRGVLVIPDFIANAGGVICAAEEYHGGTEATAFTAVEEKLRENVRTVLEGAATQNLAPRTVAVALARKRVMNAMSYRRSC